MRVDPLERRHRYRRRDGLRVVVQASVVIVGLVAAVAAGQTDQSGRGIDVLAARPPGRIRVMTWNIGADSVFPPPGVRLDATSIEEGDPGQFARVVRAVRPDVLCLQEVTRRSRDVARFVSAILPAGAGQTWHVHTSYDNAIVSRFRLRSKAGRVFTDGALRRGHTLALVDLPDAIYPRDLYVICAHFQSKASTSEVALRQRQADAIAA